jgi:DNA-binding NtrC family response regulator
MDLQSIKNRFGIIGNSSALNYALNVASQVANTDLTVLINGESGVGKEVFSQVIHALSNRKHNSFIAVNCGAIPEGTIDSELFGHEKGSFTGAVDARKGYFETVSGGTIFLDEIGEMPLGTQARLLRVLETGEYIRVGSSKVQKTDVRVIAATNRDLYDEVQRGKFREDLYYRLNTVPIRVPALRDRKDDIHLLFRKFVVDFAEKYKTQPVQLSDEAKQLLTNYGWRGNVRELKNIAEQISVLSENPNIDEFTLRSFLPEPLQNQFPVITGNNGNGQHEGFNNEREILYKLFFDMKRDVTELKKVMYDMLKHNGSDFSRTNIEQNHLFDEVTTVPEHGNLLPNNMSPKYQSTSIASAVNSNNNVIYHNDTDIHHHEEVEESLNIMDMEKELIIKALKKHKGKRRDASIDLGISERTLYRKLKEYDIEDL